MTKEQLRELDAEIAINVFGWEWLERAHKEVSETVVRKAIFPPEGEEWIRWNFIPSQWSPAHDDTPAFADWDRCCSKHDGEKSVPPHCLPFYSTDAGAALEVLEKCILRCREKTLRAIVIDNHYGSSGTISIGFEGVNGREVAASTLPLAICLFAKLMFKK